MSGGVTDVYKCFDQVLRPLVYMLLAEPGMPKGILEACKDFQENLMYYNILAGCSGQPYRKVASIPQGDPSA